MSNNRKINLFLKLYLSFFLLFLITNGLFAQGIPIGQWRHHLPNNTIISLAELPNKIIGANPYGLMIYNKNDNSIERFNKVHGLSDFGVSKIKYISEKELLFIAYKNGNIDLKQNNKVYNIPDIKRASIIGSKKINKVVIDDNTAYLATGFGIVNLNLSDFSIRDTYYIGPEGSQIYVNDLLHTDDYIYAATNGGVYKADTDAPNLADFNYWNRIEELPDAFGNYNYVTSLDNYVFTNLTVTNNNNTSDTLYFYDGDQWNVFRPDGEDYFHPRRQVKEEKGELIVITRSFIDTYNADFELTRHVDNYYDGNPNPHDAIIDEQDYLWIGDNHFGMVKMTSPNSSKKIRLHGPSSSNSFAITSSRGSIWVAPSQPGIDNLSNYDGFFRFTDERWHDYNRRRYEEMEGVPDITDISIDPGNPDRSVISTWFDGIFIFDGFDFKSHYNDDNSTLQPRTPTYDRIWISSTAFDSHNNIWVANARVEKPLSVKTPQGDWFSFELGGIAQSDWYTDDMIIDDQNQKWIIMRGENFHSRNGIIVFRENSLNNNDYDVKHVTRAQGSGGLPSNEVTAIAKDHNGYIWVATSEGVVVFYSPHNVLTGQPFNAQPIILEEDGFAGLLFGNETVNSITVDGSNKKWFGTSRAGAFLMAPDGRTTIKHFDVDNSPLPSNNVRDIAVEPETGEVFFSTDQGIASYRGYATKAEKQHSNVYAYPNPVKPGYNGYIAVKGLVRNADVKITDINGNLVYETIAEGGQAIWDGRNMRGSKPGSGVYLVFSTDEEGNETVVTKILFLN